MTICVFSFGLDGVGQVHRTRTNPDRITLMMVPAHGVAVSYSLTPADATKLYDALAGVLGLLDSEGNAT